MKRINLLTADFKPETVVLANGEFPRNELVKRVLQNTAFLVCCDGAVNQLLNHTNLIPNYIVGDCDSVSEENRKRFAHIIRQFPDQETNDLTKTVKFCNRLGRKDITILGATGKREVHTLANITLLAHYVKAELGTFRMLTDYGMFVAVDADTEFQCFAGQQISLFAMDDEVITTHGLKYPLHRQKLPEWWQGALNEALADSFTLRTQGVVIVGLEW